MGKKLHVGNLGSSVGDSALNELFAPHGTVESAKVIMDRALEPGDWSRFGRLLNGTDPNFTPIK